MLTPELTTPLGLAAPANTRTDRRHSSLLQFELRIGSPISLISCRLGICEGGTLQKFLVGQRLEKSA
jgi:hypothetical protein